MKPHDQVEIKEKLAGRRVVASVSGGKDSGAMSLYLTELGTCHCSNPDPPTKAVCAGGCASRADDGDRPSRPRPKQGKMFGLSKDETKEEPKVRWEKVLN